MDKLKTSATGGFPFVLDDIRQFLGRLSGSQGIYQAFNNILGSFGDNFIVQGCVLGGTPGAFTLTEGWIILDGELIKVDAQGPFDQAIDNTFVKVTTFDPRGNKTFQNATVEDTYEKNRADIIGSAGSLSFIGDALGVWQVYSFDAADFTSSTGTWTTSGSGQDIRTFILGKMMVISLRITISTIASGPTAAVEFKIPRDKDAIGNVMTTLGEITIAGNREVATLDTVNGTTIRITRLDGSTIPNGSFIVNAQMTFEIN